jgi:hypothetical protein
MESDLPPTELRIHDAGWHKHADGTERLHHVSREPKETTEERASILDAHNLHIFQDGGDGGDWVVWLNTEVSDFDGLVIGIGKTRDEAVAQAVAVVECIERTLQGGPHV